MREEVVIRLECLKLAHNNVHKAEDILARAKAYEDYVLGAAEIPPGRKPGGGAQNRR